MHALDTHHRTAHRVAAITGRMPTPESVMDASPQAVVIPWRRPARPTRDGVHRPTAVVPLDAQQRIFVRKVSAELAWAADTPLVLTITAGSVTVQPGTATRPELTRVRIDGQGRLRLPTRVLAVLDLKAADAVMVVALPQLGEMRLFAAADVAQQATGALTLPPAFVGTGSQGAVELAVPARRSRVRAPFRPATSA